MFLLKIILKNSVLKLLLTKLFLVIKKMVLLKLLLMNSILNIFTSHKLKK